MRMTKLYTRTLRDAPQSDVSKNAQLLTRAGFVHKLMAGAYTFQPLGLRVLNKIEAIIREEMNAIDGQEIVMPALQPREVWDATGRWDQIDVLFKLKGAGDRDLALGPTHEEVVTPLVTSYIRSYRDLPQAVYQLQTKFRNEARAKSGLLRGREFRMKDMYSFHATAADLDAFYERATEAYVKIYQRLGLGDITLRTFASGGAFCKYSHEFQTITPYGEDTIYRPKGMDIAINKEIMDDKEALAGIVPHYKEGDEKEFEEMRAIEVGNIFKLGSRFSDAIGANYTDQAGTQQKIHMGCYGIGPSRVMGTIAECMSDDKGLIWSEEIAPYQVHLVSLAREEAEIAAADALYQQLEQQGFSVLYDDRAGVQAGEKLADADLIGIPHRVLISRKTMAENALEYKHRKGEKAAMMPLDAVLTVLRAAYGK